jgi:hypothetical protein
MENRSRLSLIQTATKKIIAKNGEICSNFLIHCLLSFHYRSIGAKRGGRRPVCGLQQTHPRQVPAERAGAVLACLLRPMLRMSDTPHGEML